MGLLDLARRRGITEGVLGGNRRWLVLGGVAWGIRFIGAATRREERVVYRQHLRPGEGLLITESQPARKRPRRN